jgi:hypothetical protein
MSKQKTDRTPHYTPDGDDGYTVRPLGCAAWGTADTLRGARRLADEARDAGLRNVVIVDDVADEVVE